MTQFCFEPSEELAQVALIGLERLVGAAPLVGQMRQPRADRIAQVLGRAVEHRRRGFP